MQHDWLECLLFFLACTWRCRQRHKMLLEALLPKELIRDLHTSGNVAQYGGPRIMQAGGSAGRWVGGRA